MANRFKIASIIQNYWEGTGTIPKAVQKLPEYVTELDGKYSLSVSFTGTDSHTISNDAGSVSGDGGAITYRDPFGTPLTMEADLGTGAGHLIGFAIHVERAVSATAPTGHVRFTNSGMGGWTSSSYLTLKEDAYMVFHNPEGPTSADSSAFTIDLANGTGYRVNFLMWFEPPA